MSIVRPPTVAVLALCLGLVAANAARLGAFALIAAASAAGTARLVVHGRRATAVALALLFVGWWWGSVRLDRIDASTLLSRIGTAERSRVVVTAPPRSTRFETRAQGVMETFGRVHVRERVEIRLARAPPGLQQGSVLEGIALITQPKSASNGFDERVWLRRRGIHVVVRLDAPRVVGLRHGLAGWVDQLRRWLAASATRGVHGERKALLVGIVLGDDGGIGTSLRDRFRASGLYHLLAVSGQNVALIASGALALVWLAGLSRFVGHACALAAILAYVCAVGGQPSVVRAGIVGCLTSVAWLSGRLGDRWHFLAFGAVALLAWNPYTVYDAGFQLSFVAVIAIFVFVPRIREVVEGYPVHRIAVEAIAVSAACGVVTAPILWVQFHRLSLVAIPANVLVAPVMPVLLGLAFVGAALVPVAPAAATAASAANGWLAAYIAWCARFTGGLPGAQITTTRGLLALLGAASLVAAYACGSWRPRSSPSI